MTHMICKLLKLIRLSQPADLNGSYVETVPLPKNCAPSGLNCVISGWGALTQGGSSPSRLQALIELLK